MTKDEIEIGKVYEAEFPFVIVDDGLPRWKPGVNFDDDGYGDRYPWANGEGLVKHTAIEIHTLPRPYHKRVFYTRSWVDPDGNQMGRRSLRIATVWAFKRMLKGWDPDQREGDLEIVPPTDEQRKAIDEMCRLRSGDLQEIAA